MSTTTNIATQLEWVQKREGKIRSSINDLHATSKYSRLCNFPFHFELPFLDASENNVGAAAVHLGRKAATQLFQMRAEWKLRNNTASDNFSLQQMIKQANTGTNDDLADGNELPWWDDIENYPVPHLMVFRNLADGGDSDDCRQSCGSGCKSSGFSQSKSDESGSCGSKSLDNVNTVDCTQSMLGKVEENCSTCARVPLLTEGAPMSLRMALCAFERGGVITVAHETAFERLQSEVQDLQEYKDSIPPRRAMLIVVRNSSEVKKLRSCVQGLLHLNHRMLEDHDKRGACWKNEVCKSKLVVTSLEDVLLAPSRTMQEQVSALILSTTSGASSMLAGVVVDMDVWRILSKACPTLADSASVPLILLWSMKKTQALPEPACHDSDESDSIEDESVSFSYESASFSDESPSRDADAMTAGSRQRAQRAHEGTRFDLDSHCQYLQSQAKIKTKTPRGRNEELVQNKPRWESQRTQAQKRVRWTRAEDDALLAGMKAYPKTAAGRFQWAPIKRDPRWAQTLERRSNVDMQNRWKNLQKAKERKGQHY